MKKSKGEMAKRSRLVGIVRDRDFVRGNLTVRDRVCGKSNCRCASGHKHSSLYLSYSQDGKMRQIYIPEKHQETVREWVTQYKDARSLLEAISALSLRKLPGVKGRR